MLSIVLTVKAIDIAENPRYLRLVDVFACTAPRERGLKDLSIERFVTVTTLSANRDCRVCEADESTDQRIDGSTDRLQVRISSRKTRVSCLVVRRIKFRHHEVRLRGSLFLSVSRDSIRYAWIVE